MKTGKLDGALAYLSGAMEYVADHGIDWRREFIELSTKAGLKIDYIDPTNKPGPAEHQIGENKVHQEMLQKTGRFAELKEYVEDFRHLDLRYTDLSDFLIVSISPGVPQWGTANEVFQTEHDRKPMFFICPGGMHQFPRWLFGPADLDMIFESSEQVIERLVKLDRGELPLSKKWVLIRKEIEFRRSLPIHRA